MIRRNLPLTCDDREWLLVPQREHARAGGQLAAAWGGVAAAPVVCEPDAPDRALRAARDETLEAIRRHDEGWTGWDAAPGIDAQGRPYGFTEMPRVDAQRIWGASIARCREVGPLAGWIVAGHFIALQAKADDNHADWRAWLDEQEAARDGWLAEWRAGRPAHTEAVAHQALFYLQTFDWLSLWLCCRAPIGVEDAPEASAPLVLHDAAHGFGPYRFEPLGGQLGHVAVSPWPFVAPTIRVEAAAWRAPVARYDKTAPSLLNAASETRIAWTLQGASPAGAASP